MAGFAVDEVRLGDDILDVAIADESVLRSVGLMFVEDLGDLEGMLFVFETDVTNAFWMKNTLIPLDIAFFSSGGVLVDLVRMEPCEADPCPVYRSAGIYRYALERPAGTMMDILSPSSVLDVAGLESG